MAKGQKYRAAMERIDPNEVYPPAAALKIVKEVAPAKFDETVEVHIKLGVDARQAEQQVRGTVVLPHGTGKSVHVIVFAQGEKEREATAAGADEVGSADLAEKIQKGWTDFDAAVATPDMMGTVGKLGKILGPRGLMPNPKSGTVTFDVAKAVKDLKAGRVEFRVDKSGIVHVAVGKVSFTEEQLGENYAALMDEINRARPSAAKGKYLRSVTVTSTMGPGVRVDTSKAADLTDEAV